MQAPWRFTGVDQWPLKENQEKDIALEIQVNVANSTQDGRVGVLKWYNTTANTYQNASALAPGILEAHTLSAQRPTITTQPANQKVPMTTGTIGAFTVAATSPDGGALSYQWYKATGEADFNGTVVSGATSESFTPTDSISAVNTFYYYVVVTNTKGTSSQTTRSNMAQLQIYDGSVAASDIVVDLTGQTVKNDSFSPGYTTLLTINVGGTGVDIDNYSGWVIEIKYANSSGVVQATYQNAKQLVFSDGTNDGTIWNFGADGQGGQAVVQTGDTSKVTRTGWGINGGTMPSVIKQVKIGGTPVPASPNEDLFITSVEIVSITFIAK
jgi:hypothetical protein